MTTAAPSPFAANVSWKRTNELMYEDDTPSAGRSRLRQDLIREVVFAAHLRPRIARALADTSGGSSSAPTPATRRAPPSELLAWAVERVVIPVGEWRELLDAVNRDHGLAPDAVLAELCRQAGRGGVAFGGRAFGRLRGGERAAGRCGRLSAARIRSSSPRPPSTARPRARPSPPWPRCGLAPRAPSRTRGRRATRSAELLGELLRFYGPVGRELLTRTFALDRRAGAGGAGGPARRAAGGGGRADRGRGGAGDLRRREPGAPVAAHQGRGTPSVRAAPGGPPPGVPRRPGRGWPRRARASRTCERRWNGCSGIPPPRSCGRASCSPRALNRTSRRGWTRSWQRATSVGFGCGQERLAFALASDRELFVQDPVHGAGEDESGAGSELDAALPPGPGRFSFEELMAHSGLGSAELTRRLWRLVVGRRGRQRRFRGAAARYRGRVRAGRGRAVPGGAPGAPPALRALEGLAAVCRELVPPAARGGSRRCARGRGAGQGPRPGRAGALRRRVSRASRARAAGTPVAASVPGAPADGASVARWLAGQFFTGSSGAPVRLPRGPSPAGRGGARGPGLVGERRRPGLAVRARSRRPGRASPARRRRATWSSRALAWWWSPSAAAGRWRSGSGPTTRTSPSTSAS